MALLSVAGGRAEREWGGGGIASPHGEAEGATSRSFTPKPLVPSVGSRFAAALAMAARTGRLNADQLAQSESLEVSRGTTCS